MAAAKTVSLNHFHATVKSAVKTAVKKHPKFHKTDETAGVAFSYLIRGIPVPDELLKTVTVAETEAFASEIAAGIQAGQVGAAAELLPKSSGGSMIHAGGHLIIGIILEPFVLEQ